MKLARMMKLSRIRKDVFGFICAAALILTIPGHGNAQFSPGTMVNIGKGISVDVSMSDEDSSIKNTANKEVGKITNYAGKLTVDEGSKVAIRTSGGLLQNINNLKGRAVFTESFQLNDIPVTREVTYLDGKGTVNKCTVKGAPADRFQFSDGSYLKLSDPEKIIRLKVISK